MESNNKPQIRFKGFTDDWEKRKLVEFVADVLDYRGKSPSKFGLNWETEGFLVLSALNVKDGYIDKSIEAKYGSQELLEKWMGERRLFKGDVVFTTEAPLGNVAQIPDNNGYILNQRAVAFKTAPNVLDNNFLAQLLRSPLFQYKLVANSSGGTVKGIGMKEFAKLTASIPKEVNEQSKIGEFFKTLDETIALHQQKLDSTKQLKKAMLQKMFPKKGEKIPEIRFKGFSEEWKEANILKIGSFKKGTQINKELLSSKRTSEHKYPVFNGSLNPIGYYSEYNKEFGLMMTEGGDVGRVMYSTEPYWSSGHSYSISSNHNIRYLQYLFEANYVEINKKGLGITIKNLSYKSLNQIFLKITSENKEQELIGNYFKDLDTQISSLESKLDIYKQFKKAMLQKMFV